MITLETPEFVSWLAGVRKIYTDYMREHFPKQIEEIEVTEGARYIKLSRVRYYTEEMNGVLVKKRLNGSVHAFLDKKTGDVLKPASWNAPAKHARGNIFDESNGLKYITNHGPAYLR